MVTLPTPDISVIIFHVTVTIVRNRGLINQIDDISACCFMLLHVTLCHSLSLPLCHYMSLYATTCHFMPLHVTTCHYMSLHVTTCHYMSLHATTCHFMPLPVTHSMSLHTTSCYSLLLYVTSYIVNISEPDYFNHQCNSSKLF